ncbi:MAG: EAL domain-containing protein [Aquificaceae bacterium]|nr:EAL domain-containing protein [Aquificaceae bacterium]
MHKYISILLLLGGALATFIAFLYRDQLVLDRSSFAFWIATLRITSFAFLFFIVLTLLALGPRIVCQRFYLIGVFLIPSLVPDLFHILSFVFFPDFITKNTRNKVAYLFLLSRSLVVLALYISVFHDRVFSGRFTPAFTFWLLTFLSLFSSFYVVLFHHELPPLFVEGFGQPWYRDMFDYVSIVLMAFLAFYIKRREIFGKEGSWYMSASIGLLALSSLSLALYKHFYDFLIVLASAERLFAYALLMFSILYLGVREEAVHIMNATKSMLGTLLRSKPEMADDVLILSLGRALEYAVQEIYLYSLEDKRLVAHVYGERRDSPPTFDMNGVVKLVKGLGGQYFDRDFYYHLYDGYLLVAKIGGNLESPLVRLHIINMSMLVLGFLLNWLNFNRVVDEKSKELQRLYLLLETSEYATQAYNNVDTFSKQVLERLDYVLKADGGVFYMWNKNAELPDRVVFSTGFLQNFSHLETHQLIEKVIESARAYGSDNNYIYCKFESSSYQSGVVSLRKSGAFSEEELLFLKTVGNQLFHVVKLMKVIEDLEKTQANIKLLTEYDPLTMLYNRKSFEKLLEEEIERSDRFGDSLCLIFMDVDNLKVINDTYGYNVGDSLLRHIADIVRKNIRHFDMAGRLGGDEFGIILPKVSKGVVKDVARRLKQEIVGNPLFLGDLEIRPSISASVVCYPLDARNKEEMISMGEALMHVIKRERKGEIRMVDESTKELYRMFMRVEKDTLESLEKGSIEVFLQDIVNLETWKIEGFEALMRLVVKGELIPAGSFIEVAERMGLMRKLDLVMVERLFQGVSSFKRCTNCIFFINLSPQDLTQDFAKEIVSLMEAYQIKPERLVFEITEREAIQDIFKVGNFMREIKEVGFKFAIDDFGSGYASFLYLKYLPADFLKIDGEFIKSMRRSKADKTFVKSMVDVAKGLGVRTIAEYVEDKDTVEILLELGVDMAQGYYLGTPGPAEEKLRNFSSRGEDQKIGEEG